MILFEIHYYTIIYAMLENLMSMLRKKCLEVKGEIT